MAYISIPLEVLESPAYLALTEANQKFLIDLYVIFGDCSRFTIDMRKQADYRQPEKANLAVKIRTLLDAGFLKVAERIGPHPLNSRRIFSFVYPAREALEAA